MTNRSGAILGARRGSTCCCLNLALDESKLPMPSDQSQSTSRGPLPMPRDGTPSTDSRTVPEPDPPPDAGPAQGLPRLGGRRGQDLRDAPRGAPAQGAGGRRRRSAWSRPTAAPRPQSRSATWRSSRPGSIEYRGVTLREMDVDAILARRPTVCLVDELAHTNAPGSRHPKRYQDVEDLLHAGIHVITTVNVQHLESLYDEIERVTERARSRSGSPTASWPRPTRSSTSTSRSKT